MAEHERASHKTRDGVEQQHRHGQKESQLLSDFFHARDEGYISIGETPFLPQVDKHTVLLKMARSDEQRSSIVLQLQHNYGNKYVQRLIKSMSVQAKLTAGPADDPYKHEADTVAERVMRMPDSTVVDRLVTNRQLLLQRQVPEKGEELQTKPSARLITHLFQRQVQPEEEEIQTRFPTRRQKNNLVTTEGKRLLEHELTHVTQQTGLVVARSLPRITEPRLTAGQRGKNELEAKVSEYLRNKGEDTGKAAVADCTKWLESQGTVNYSGTDIAEGSPEFRTRPSMRAYKEARKYNMSLSESAGFTYGYRISSTQAQIYKVEIYPSAFAKGDSNAEILNYLLGVIVHEYIHILQNRARSTAKVSQREFQAYLWQAENIDSLGIRPGSAVAGQILNMLQEYYQQLPKADQKSLRSRYNRAMKKLMPPEKGKGQETESILQRRDAGAQKRQKAISAIRLRILQARWPQIHGDKEKIQR